MKPVSLAAWNELTQTIETIIKEQPDSIHTEDYSVSFTWMPDVAGGSIPLESHYKLFATVMYNVTKINSLKQTATIVESVREACKNNGIIDTNNIRFLPIVESAVEGETK